jgi:hypothetical protein
MLIINQEKLTAEALSNESHPLHAYAVEVDRGLKELRKRFPDGHITFVRVGYPKFTEGLTGQGVEVRDIPVPTPPMQIPLQTLHDHPSRGRELWACSLGSPKLLPGNLWDIGSKRSWTMEERKIIDIKTESDLAFYLSFISKAVKGGHIKIDDPKADIRAKADLERQEIETKTAIWNMLQDEGALRKMCQSYGIANALKKEPDALRFELQDLLKANNEKQKRDPSIKGTKEFLEEMKINDNVRLRAFIRNGIDNALIVYNPDGRYKAGDKVILQVPRPEILRKFDYLCNYMAAPNNAEKLQELMIDLVTKEYLDSVEDPKDFRFLAKSMNIDGYYNKNEETVKKMVYDTFNLT